MNPYSILELSDAYSVYSSERVSDAYGNDPYCAVVRESVISLYYKASDSIVESTVKEAVTTIVEVN